jgi:drug/metabolite transporter (DMT)-like permease
VARLVPAAFVGTFLGLWLMQLGIKNTESAVANALHSTTPLFTLPITVFLLRERLGWLAVTGSFVAVGGVVLLLSFAA